MEVQVIGISACYDGSYELPKDGIPSTNKLSPIWTMMEVAETQ
jgi:hypothetical protein